MPLQILQCVTFWQSLAFAALQPKNYSPSSRMYKGVKKKLFSAFLVETNKVGCFAVV